MGKVSAPDNEEIMRRLRDKEGIMNALRQAQRHALDYRVKLGLITPFYLDGKIVWLSPEETKRRFLDTEPG